MKARPIGRLNAATLGISSEGELDRVGIPFTVVLASIAKLHLSA